MAKCNQLTPLYFKGLNKHVLRCLWNFVCESVRLSDGGRLFHTKMKRNGLRAELIIVGVGTLVAVLHSGNRPRLLLVGSTFTKCTSFKTSLCQQYAK